MPHSSRSAIGLQVRVSLLVLMVTMVLLAGFAFWEHTLLREAEEMQLRQETRLLADRAARLLALPLWNLDGPSARAIIQAEMDDPRVYGIAVFEQGRQLFEGMQRDASWRVVPWVGSAPPDVVEERRDLVVEGTQVGSLSIMVSPRFLAARLAERFQQAVWRYTLLAGILAVGLMLLVRSVLIAPLGRLGGVARRVTSEENFALRAPKGADDEIGELVDSFNAMLERIEQRNRLLGEQRRRLEMEVSERTAEFVGARERAERESKAMADFLAAITHEVRTPMTGIIGLLDISLRGQNNATLSSPCVASPHDISGQRVPVRTMERCSSSVLHHAPRDAARGGPATPRGPERASPATSTTASETRAASTGVRVSPRACVAASRVRPSAKAGNPGA